MMPRPKNKLKSEQLFDDTFEAEDKIIINKSFAGNYEEKKRKQELSRARDLGIDLEASNESEDEESEDEGELLTKAIDKGILKTIHAIRKKDPAIYNPEKQFFEDEPETSEEEHVIKPKSLKKVTAKDVLRTQLLEAAASGRSDAFADEDEEGVDESRRKSRLREETKAAKIYNKEQADIRQAFLNTLEVDATSASSDEDDAGLKRKRMQKAIPNDVDRDSEEQPQVSRDELRKYLQSKHSSAIAEHAEDIADPDKFLEAFVSSRAWHEDSDNDGERFDVPDEVDEAEVEKADEFEAQYNFR
jgi:protein KRI1